MADTTKLSEIYWVPSDYLKDINIKMCSLAAQGLWINMINIMHSGVPYGHLSIDVDEQMNPSVNRSVNPALNHPLNLESLEPQLAAMVGSTEEIIRPLLSELEKRRVFSRTEAGIIYSRRMVRDYNKRVKNSISGKKGGNPNLKKEPKETFSSANEGEKITLTVNVPVIPGLNRPLNPSVNAPVETDLKQPIYSSNNNNLNNNSIVDKGGVGEKKERKKRERSTEVTFAESPYFTNFELFKNDIGADYQQYDIRFYYETVKNWATGRGKVIKRADWAATSRNFILRDIKEGKAKKAETKLTELKFTDM